MNDRKTPRAWLLSRYNSATPELDALRRAALDSKPATKGGNFPSSPFSTWREVAHALFFPNRVMWRILVGTWVGLAVFQVTIGRSSPPANESNISPAVAAAWMAQLKSYETFAQVDRFR